jgi:hypothetical protein
VLVEADVVELGELVVIADHRADDAGLVGHDLDIGGSPLAGAAGVHRFTGVQIACPQANWLPPSMVWLRRV